jgi:Putative zinc-finger
MGSAIGGEHMNYCRKWQETLWLDVYGELPPKEHPVWKQHLEGCRPCRQERERLLHLLNDVTEAMPEAFLSHRDAGVLHNSAMEKLKAQRNGKAGRQQSFYKGYIKPAYALVAFCLAIAAFGWFGLKELHQTTRVGNISNLGTNEQLIAQDIDLLENLELLKEMDTLEKLDQVMGKGKKTT